MSQDELAVMDGGKCILQLRGVRPFLSTRLKPKPNEVYDVFEVDVDTEGE